MPHVTLELKDRVAVVRFDNPPLQVMTAETLEQIGALLPRLRLDDVRAVIVTGNAASGYFVRHYSIEELDELARSPSASSPPGMTDVLWELEHLDKPVIAALDGTALGGGLELALACDIRVAKDGPARFGLPEVSVGILPGGGGTQRLTAIVGRGRALNWMLRPKLLSPSEAHAAGIVDELVPADTRETALQRSQAIAAQIATRSPHAVKQIKTLVRAAASPVDRAMLERESRAFGEVMVTEEARAGLACTAASHRQERERAG